MGFEKVPLIGSKHSDETRNIINLMVQIINDRGVEILSDSAFLNWLEENGVKHRGEWSSTEEYDRQSVVLHEGASYTSKKQVPVGIEIDNREFWVITGNYNAQVEYYREETEGVRQELTKKSDITYVDIELDKKTDVITSRVDYKIPSDYLTLQEALNDIVKKHSSGIRVGITIESGHNPKLKTTLRDCSLPNVVIYADDEIVQISDVLNDDENLFDLSNVYGLQISCLIDMGSQGYNGFFVRSGSFLRINQGCGLINAGNNGITVREGGTAYCPYSIFTGASQIHTDGSGITAWGGIVIAHHSDVSNSKAYGARSAHGGTLDFDSGIANNVSYHAIRASQNGRLTCRFSEVNNAGIHGIYALNASQINAVDSVINNTANTALFSSGTSQIYGSGIKIDGCDIGARCENGSTLSFYSGTVDNAVSNGITATFSSVIEARNARVEGNQGVGLRADESSTINAQGGFVYGSLLLGARALNNSRMNLRACNIRNTNPGNSSAHGVFSEGMSVINIQNGSSWNNGGNDLRVDTGGSIGANGCLTSANTDSGSPREPSNEDINITDFNNFYRQGYILN